jgi:hypothetical protein
MKIFISWSGEQSKHVATSLRDWVPDLFQSVKPWISSEDLVPGERWATELARELANSSFGIICLTKQNLNSPWLLFESGSLAKQLNGSFVVPYMIDVTSADIKYPLAQFLGLEANEVGTRSLMQTINNLQAEPLSEGRFKRAFEKWWPDYQQRLTSIPKESAITGPVRSEREILEEVLSLSRIQYRTQLRPLSSFTPDARTQQQSIRVLMYWHEHGFTFEESRELADHLEKNGLRTVLGKHRDPLCPDAVFIGALVGAEDARIVLTNIPYPVRYLFRPDYPTSMGGDESGFTIGIGYMGSHPQNARDATTRPILVSDNDLGNLTDPTLSNVDFQLMLRALMLRDEIPSSTKRDDPVVLNGPTRRDGQPWGR